MKLINKAAVVAEIERRIEENKADIQRATHKHLEEYFEGYEDALVLFKEKFIDTLEVKEVDLNREIEKEIETRWYGEYLFTEKFKESAKHFFELGLKAQKGEEV